jgi:hypothetical protein
LIAIAHCTRKPVFLLTLAFGLFVIQFLVLKSAIKQLKVDSKMLEKFCQIKNWLTNEILDHQRDLESQSILAFD